MMKEQIKFWAPLVAVWVIIFWVGCTTPNPQYTPILPGQPQTNTVPQYIVDPRLNSISNAVTSVATGLAPVNPYAGITSYGLNIGFGLAALISGYIARQRGGALNTLAAATVQTGNHPQVLEITSNTPHSTAIFDAINANVSGNQTLTGTPPKA